MSPTIKNNMSTGVCEQCKKNSDRLFEPPIIQPPDWDAVEIHGDQCKWQPPGTGIQKNYNLIFVDQVQYLRPWDCPNDPICWTCYAGVTSPREQMFLINEPAEIGLHGYHAPSWKGK